MKTHDNIGSTPELHTLPYLYGGQDAAEALSAEQRLPLFAPGSEPEPELEALKTEDPDSYRMVVYSWG